MTSSTETPQIALSRVDGLLNKVFASAVLLLTIDVVQNAFRQIQYLNPIWFWSTLTALLVSVLGLVASAFFIGKSRYWYRAIVVVTWFTLLTWVFQVRNYAALPNDFKPWIWWALGFAAVASVGAWSRIWAYLSLILSPVLWVYVATRPQGGGATFFVAIQDGIYAFFFSVGISLLALELKNRAIELDRENELVLEAGLERVRLEAMRIERAHLNSVLIGKSIEALHVAASAVTARQKTLAISFADEAIGRLNREIATGATPPDMFGVKAILEPLENAILNRSPDCTVIIKGDSDLQLDYHLTAGIYEATMLAVNNSLVHAPGATERTVIISANSRGLKIVVADNGVGFRMSSVHKTSLGVKWVIFRRLESLGVKARLDSSPGKGTTWIFEWYP